MSTTHGHQKCRLGDSSFYRYRKFALPKKKKRKEKKYLTDTEMHSLKQTNKMLSSVANKTRFEVGDEKKM